MSFEANLREDRQFNPHDQIERRALAVRMALALAGDTERLSARDVCDSAEIIGRYIETGETPPKVTPIKGAA